MLISEPDKIIFSNKNSCAYIWFNWECFL